MSIKDEQITSNARITVVGPGAMGCLLAACLSRTGHPTALLDHRPERSALLQEKGIRIEGREESWVSFPVVTHEPEALGVQDFVVMMVKGPQTAEAVSRLGPLVGKDTLLVSLQNGLGYESILAESVSPDHIILGVTSTGATLSGEGAVRIGGRGLTWLGAVQREADVRSRLGIFAAVLEDAEWAVEVVDDIYPFIWRKLMVNVGINAIAALTCLRNGALLDNVEAVRLQEMAVSEAWHLARKIGVDPGLSLGETLSTVRSVCADTAQNISSMLQDRLKNRGTEIDYINGAIVRMGKAIGHSTPVNESLSLLVALNSSLGWDRSCRPDPPPE